MTPSELSKFLSKTIKAKLPVLIVGQPGIGKSDIVSQSCIEAGAELVLEHPVVSDPTDFKGMPHAKDGKADFLPFGNLNKLIEADKLTVCFLDDLGQAPPSVQAACMQLLLARRINGHKVSEHVCFVAATNRHKDKAGVSGMLEPVKSRFTSIVNLVPSTDDWIKWALGNGLPTELIAFIRFRPELLNQFEPSKELKNSPSSRTVHNVAKLIKVGTPQELEMEVYQGSAGEGFAVEFTAFLQIFRKLPNPDTVLLHPDTAEIPDDPATQYAICGALARKATENNIERVITYANRMEPEFNILLVRDSIVHYAPEAKESRAYIEWCSKNSEILA